MTPQTPDMRILNLQTRIASGSYNVDPRQVAAALIAHPKARRLLGLTPDDARSQPPRPRRAPPRPQAAPEGQPPRPGRPT